MSNSYSDKGRASYRWWSTVIAIILAILLAIMWFMGYGPLRANCCGYNAASAPAAAVAAAPSAVAGAVSLAFENGKVTIKGDVGTDAEKAKLLADAATAYGAGNVIDAVTVKVGLGALGAVTLTGQVPSDAKKSADGDAAMKLFAPAKVDNQLTVAASLAANAGCADVLKATVGFATGSSQLSAEGKKALDAMAACLNQGGSVVGHTDNVGKPASNQLLSERRAQTVAAYLKAKGAGTLTAKGVGDTAPAADNTTVEGRTKNRRMEITAQ
jgi:OOP family OmpA-OmpF porin